MQNEFNTIMGYTVARHGSRLRPYLARSLVGLLFA